MVALPGAAVFPLVVGGAAALVHYGNKFIEDSEFRDRVHDQFPRYATSLGISTGFRQFLGLMAYARYYQPAWMIAAAGLHLSQMQTVREATRNFGNAVQDIEFQSPYMKPIWRN